MAPLLGDTVFEISGQGPSPSDDFFQLLVTKKQSTPHPAEIRENYQDFLLYPSLQNQVMVGTSILQYAQHLCQGQFDSLDCLPDAPLLQIMKWDMQHMSSRGQFWEQMARDPSETFRPEMEASANLDVWKVFFTNKRRPLIAWVRLGRDIIAINKSSANAQHMMLKIHF
uniref:Uncharacterized protein n=1 Tax=Paramormyrops kingsleyae TaxID=1676925 RepID=A0A3B3T2K7_9TELE